MGDRDYAMPDYGAEFEAEPHTLNARIKGAQIRLGDTDEGQSFVIKALDPSIDGIDPPGIPDITTDDVSVEKYRQFLTLQAPPLATGAVTDTYNYMIRLTGNPIAPFDVYITSAYLSTTTQAWGNSFTYINSQIPSSLPVPNYYGGGFTARQAATTALFEDKLATFKGMYQSVRGMWCSLSIKQMAASLSDQGFIVAAQQDAVPTVTYTVNSSTGAAGSVLNSFKYANNDFPDANSIFALERCFTGQSRDGVYMVTHLDNDFDKWKNLQDPVTIDPPNMPEITGSTEVVPAMFAALQTRLTDVTTSTPNLNIKPLFRNVGTIYINGVAPGTTFQIMWRGGYEGLPFSSSLASTHSHPSPAYDQQAMVAISQIVRKHLMFAYPVSWNDGGSLFSWIGSKVSDALDWGKRHILPAAMTGLAGLATGGPGKALADMGRYVGSEAISDISKSLGMNVGMNGAGQQPSGRRGRQRRIEFVQ